MLPDKSSHELETKSKFYSKHRKTNGAVNLLKTDITKGKKEREKKRGKKRGMLIEDDTTSKSYQITMTSQISRSIKL